MAIIERDGNACDYDHHILNLNDEKLIDMQEVLYNASFVDFSYKSYEVYVAILNKMRAMDTSRRRRIYEKLNIQNRRNNDNE